MKTNRHVPSLSTRSALDRVLSDLHTLATDAETLLAATAEDAGVVAQEARKRLRSAVKQARETYEDLRDRAVAGARVAAEEADAAIRAHPYKSLGIAVGAGLLIGFIACGRSSEE